MILIFLIIEMYHTILDQKKDSKNVLEEAFFFHFSSYFLNRIPGQLLMTCELAR